MALIVHQFACLADNYGFLIRDESSGRTACIDTPDAEVILAELRRLGWSLDFILNTHWHPDHAGGNQAVQQATGALVIGPAEVQQLSPVDRLVAGGDSLFLGDSLIKVIDVGGHTLGHVAFHAPQDGMVFVGDTLFPLGCGRLFEGTPAQMWQSLQRLRALPAHTLVYSAHEYALGNARFAREVDPEPAVQARALVLEQARQRQEPTVPSLLADELATNPFFRAALLPMSRGAADDVAAFALVRVAKDEFVG